MLSRIQKSINLLYAQIKVKTNPNYILQYIEQGDLETIKAFVENGFDIHTKFEYNNNLLAVATYFSHYEMCEYLKTVPIY